MRHAINCDLSQFSIQLWRNYGWRELKNNHKNQDVIVVSYKTFTVMMFFGNV